MGAEDLGDCARLALAGFAGVNFFAADVGLDEGSFLLGAAFDGADTTLSISSSFFSTSALTLLSVHCGHIWNNGRVGRACLLRECFAMRVCRLMFRQMFQTRSIAREPCSFFSVRREKAAPAAAAKHVTTKV